MLPPLNVPCDNVRAGKKEGDAEFCVSKSSIFICVVGSNAISDHQIHVDSDDKGRDLKGWKGRKLRIPHENFATCICFFLKSFSLFVNADDVFVFFVFSMPMTRARSSPLLRLPMDISIHTDTYYVNTNYFFFRTRS